MRPPLEPPRRKPFRPSRPAWAMVGLLNGSLIRPGVVALAAHDQRNQPGAVVVFDGHPLAKIARYESLGASDILLGHLERTTDLPAPAMIATVMPAKGETVYVLDNAGAVHEASVLGHIGDTFQLAPSFRSTIGDSGGAIFNAAGELLGHVRYGTSSPFYAWWLGKPAAKRKP